jgi:hypothetical protein
MRMRRDAKSTSMLDWPVTIRHSAVAPGSMSMNTNAGVS